MSDMAKLPNPAKSAAEIEDVLSSVRRLVSEHHPHELHPVAQPDTDKTAQAAPGHDEKAADEKLVLTPALRVMDPDDPWAPVPSQASDTQFDPEDRLSDWGDVASSDAPETPASHLEEHAAHLADIPHVEDAVAEFLEDSDPAETASDLAEPEADPADLEDLVKLDGVAVPEDDFEPETGDANWPDSNANGALRHLVAARAGDADTFPNEENLSDATRADATEIDTSDVHEEQDHKTETADMTRNDAQEASEPSDETDDTAFQPIFSRRPWADVAADTTAEPVIETAEELDVAHPTDLQADTEAMSSDHDDSDADSIEDLGETPSPFSFPDAEEGILDEDTLREIIVDVVREELQGVLGQRITRNVRKMVRREIRLALAAEELE